MEENGAELKGHGAGQDFVERAKDGDGAVVAEVITASVVFEKDGNDAGAHIGGHGASCEHFVECLLSKKGGEWIGGGGFRAGRFINSFAVYASEDLEKFGGEFVEAGCGTVGHHTTDGAGNVEWVEFLVQGEAGTGVSRESFAFASEGFEKSGLCTSVGDEVEVVEATRCAVESIGVGIELFLGGDGIEAVAPMWLVGCGVPESCDGIGLLGGGRNQKSHSRTLQPHPASRVGYLFTAHRKISTLSKDVCERSGA